jgi:hypothetical protein
MKCDIQLDDIIKHFLQDSASHYDVNEITNAIFSLLVRISFSKACYIEVKLGMLSQSKILDFTLYYIR